MTRTRRIKGISFLLGLATFATVAVRAPSAMAAPPDSAPAEQAPATSLANALQVDLGLAVIGLAYERVFAHRFAIQVELQGFGTWFGPLFDLPHVSGFGGQIRPTWFVLADAPQILDNLQPMRGEMARRPYS